jgi:cytochrome c
MSRRRLRVALAALFAALSILPAHAGDAARGKTYFARCAMCHSNTKGAPNRIGPNLFGIVGRKAAAMQGFFYSGAMKHSNITWTPEKLKAYIASPQKVVSGNRMAFAGVSSPAQVDDLVAYLQTLK